MGSVKRKLQALWRHRLTETRQLIPETTYPVKPLWAIPISIGLLFLEFVYFQYLVPYDTIPSIPVFWGAFACWAAAPVVANWRYRNLPTKRQVDKYSNFFIGFGVVGLVVAIVARRVDLILPVAYALMPGAMAGGLAGTITVVIWSIYKGGGPTTSNAGRPAEPPSQMRLD